MTKEVNVEYLSCPIRQVISKFGDKWSLLVLYHLHKSPTGVLRFGELHRQMSDCSQKMLSQTLKNLEHYNMINRKVYPVVPPKVEYSLTDAGRSFMPNLESMVAWAKSNWGSVVTDC